MDGQRLDRALLALLFGLAAACTTLSLATARSTGRRDPQLAGVGGWPSRLASEAARRIGGLIAAGAGAYAAAMWLALPGIIQNRASCHGA